MPKQGDNWGIVAAPRPASSHAGRGVAVKSPRERLAEAIAAGPLSPAERSTFRSQLAAVVAQDDARRAAPSLQTDLPLELAA